MIREGRGSDDEQLSFHRPRDWDDRCIGEIVDVDRGYMGGWREREGMCGLARGYGYVGGWREREECVVWHVGRYMGMSVV